VIFYIEKFYCNSAEKIQIGLISNKIIRRYTCGLLQLLEETPLGKITASLFAHDGTITSKGILLYWVRMKRLLPVSGAHIFLCFVCTNSRQATIVSPFKWNMLRLFHRRD